MPPLSDFKIVKYCGVCGGGGALNPIKNNARPHSSISVIKYCGVWGGGGGALGDAKILQNVMAPLSLLLR